MTTEGDKRRANAEFIRQSGCEGKTTFESRKLAVAVASRHGGRSIPQRCAYRCQFCRKWHLGGHDKTPKGPAVKPHRKASDDE